MPGPSRRHVPSSAISLFIDPERISRLLEPWVPDAEDRRFVVRCLLEEGPAHHRGANYVLLALLGQLVEKLGAAPATKGDTIRVPMRLPPGAAGAQEGGEEMFPLAMPARVLERLARPGSPEHDGIIDCLTDGPPQHALGNAAMVCLIGALLEQAESRKG